MQVMTGETYGTILNRALRGIFAGLVATLVLWLLKLSKGIVPQLEIIHFLDRVTAALARAGALPQLPMAGWIWHLVIGTLVWGTLFGIMFPVLPGRRPVVKGAAFGVITGLLVMLLVMPLEAAGYFGMQLTLWDPLISVFFHVIYGVTLGWVFAILTAASR
jgi:hypothetical protein